jgi:MFS family permease
MFYGWWLVLVGLITQGVGAGSIVYAYSVLVLPLEREFQATRMAMMWGLTCSSLVAGLASPWLGLMADRRSMRSLMAAGVLLLAMGFALLSFTAAVWQVALCYALFMSFAQVLLGPLTAATLIARWFSRRRGLALGLAAVGTGVGGLLLPPVLQALITACAWRSACRWFAVIIVALTLPPTLFVVSDPAEKGLWPDGDPGTPLPASAMGGGGVHLTTARILRRFDFWAIALSVGVVFATANMLLSKLLFGAVADRVDLRLALAVGMGVVCLALALFRSGKSAEILGIASFALGLASGGILPLWGTMLGHAFGAQVYGRVMGLMNPVITPLVLVSPPLAGHIFDMTGTYRLAFEIFFAVVLLAAVPLVRLPAMSRQAG